MYKFKEIATIPQAKDFIDIVLSKTQRKTPTVVHPGYNIVRIRKFYLRKIKYCQSSFSEKLQKILDEFPRIDDIHPFYADLGNVLYDRDHFKLALGQCNTVKNTIDNIAKEYVRMTKFADSMYKCKMLKRAAMGRMCTCLKKMSSSLKYLEEVRQHLARLPTINPSTRTLIVTGYPNVGKSSFMNIVTNANVDVQPYAFTTKSIFVGHMDYEYCRWQVLDTPGILDHPLEERNSIEMTAITALAHINASILFFLDISEQCGYTIKAQVHLFHSIKPLFKNKPVLIVLNKIDVKRVENLTDEELTLIKSCTEGIEDADTFPTSCFTKEGVDAVRTRACQLLLTRRVEAKVTQHKVDSMENRLHVTKTPASSKRPPFIPQSVLKAREAKENDEPLPAKKTERDIEEEMGGAGVHNIDIAKDFILEDEVWKYDMVPDMMDGRNVSDFIDPDIMAKLEALEKEEDLLLAAEGLMDTEEVLAQARETQVVLNDMHSRISLKKTENRLRASSTRMGQGGTARRAGKKLSDVVETMEERGIDVSEDKLRGRSKNRKRLRSVDESLPRAPRDPSQLSAKKFVSKVRCDRSKARSKSRIELGLTKAEDRAVGEYKKRKVTRELSRMGKKGEADKWIPDMKPKHLYSGKRGNGKTDRR